MALSASQRIEIERLFPRIVSMSRKWKLEDPLGEATDELVRAVASFEPWGRHSLDECVCRRVWQHLGDVSRRERRRKAVEQRGARVFYAPRPDVESAVEKLDDPVLRAVARLRFVERVQVERIPGMLGLSHNKTYKAIRLAAERVRRLMDDSPVEGVYGV